MCGLIGAFTKSPLPEFSCRRALSSLYRRGPDAEGEWREAGVYLGHRRLAILDLESRAGQPMKSPCGRYVIVFNGEIYNFRDMREKLSKEGVEFFTTSDTEVILALFAAEGEAMLSKLRGMFSFVIWDRYTRRAFAARDPYGIKPLYVATTKDGVLLGSQVKALLATGLVSREPDPCGQAGFWMLGSVPEPHTWFLDIQAVPAGHFLWIEQGQVVKRCCWHDVGAAWRECRENSVAMGAGEIQSQVRNAIRESAARHLVADVPVGVFLSGGIDSGAIAGLMVDVGAKDLQGVTIAYDEFAGRHCDEAPAAGKIARHYGIRHHVRRVSRLEFLEDLPRIFQAMDQPSIDGINTWYASKAASELGLKVVLSGVGGDELFLGYDSFRQLPRLVSLWRLFSRLPGAMSLAQGAAELQARRSGNGRWRYAPQWLQSVSGAWWLRRSCLVPEALPSLMEGTKCQIEDFAPETWVRAMAGLLSNDLTLALAQIESTTYLRNQLLRDSDWSSMDHSVELRTPLADAYMLAQLKPLLPEFKRFPGKSLLATAPLRPLPASILQRRKTGFAIPIEQWIEGSGDFNYKHSKKMTWQQIIGLEFS